MSINTMVRGIKSKIVKVKDISAKHSFGEKSICNYVHILSIELKVVA